MFVLIVTMSPTIKAGCYYWGNLRTSHFETPKGVSVWLATFVQCLTASVLAIGFPLSDALRHFFRWKNNVKNPDKNLSGKSDEREVKICKNRGFTLHPSFFILRKLRFLTPIPYL